MSIICSIKTVFIELTTFKVYNCTCYMHCSAVLAAPEINLLCQVENVDDDVSYGLLFKELRRVTDILNCALVNFNKTAVLSLAK